MLTAKPIILSIMAACGIAAGAANPPAGEPDKEAPKPPPQEDQHFCCQSVDPKDWSGEGCITIAPTQIDQCANVLFCPGKWAKVDGKVTCE